MITLCATICGADGWEEIEIFAEKREDWFKNSLICPMAFLPMIQCTGYSRVSIRKNRSAPQDLDRYDSFTPR
jgi:hypothetical protein